MMKISEQKFKPNARYEIKILQVNAHTASLENEEVDMFYDYLSAALIDLSEWRVEIIPEKRCETIYFRWPVSFIKDSIEGGNWEWNDWDGRMKNEIELIRKGHQEHTMAQLLI